MSQQSWQEKNVPFLQKQPDQFGIQIEESKQQIEFPKNRNSVSSDDDNLINRDDFENIYFNRKKPIKREGCFKKLTFSWIYPLINFSRSNQFLQEENVKNIHLESSIETYIEQLKNEWKVYEEMDHQARGKHSLFQAILKAFWGYYRNLIFLNILTTFLKLLGPMIIKKLIDFIKKGEISWKLNWVPITGLSFSTEYGLFLVFILVVSQGITFIVDENITFNQEITSNFICNALIGLIYEKTLKLSPASNKKFKSSDLITFIQVDVNKLNFLCFQFPGIFQVPIYFICGFYLLYQYLGYSFLAGLAVFVFGFFCNMIVTRKNAQYQKLYMNYQKDRVSMISECLSNIKTLKIFSWIEIFENEIKMKREKELNIQYYKFQLGMLSIAFVILFPQLMSTIAIAAFVYMGNSLEISTAYTINIVFNLVKVPLRMLPQFISQLTEFLLAMNRIQEFLVCDEINPTISCVLENNKEENQISQDPQQIQFNNIKNDKNVAIQLRFNGYYHWGVHLQDINKQNDNPNVNKNISNQNTYFNQWQNNKNKPNEQDQTKEGLIEKSKFMEIENSSLYDESYESNQSQQNILTIKKSDQNFSYDSQQIFERYKHYQNRNTDSPAYKKKSFTTSIYQASPSVRGESTDRFSNQFRKQNLTNLVTLKEINFKINKGEFVCILGDVGSGKSTIISTLIGDLLYLENDFYKLFKNMEYDGYLNERIKLMSQKKYTSQNCPIVFTKDVDPMDNNFQQKKEGIIAYAPQDPIIQNKSLRENILFGLPFDFDKYQNVIQKCQLQKDINVFPGGDMQELGERGVNLSGGQKIRISLARAVYTDRDIILMDDPISALDRGVLKSIFEDLFLGQLKNKTRIMATHSIEYLHLFDKIILLQQGKIKEIGTYEQVKYSSIIQKLKKINRQNKNTEHAFSSFREGENKNGPNNITPELKQKKEYFTFLPESRFAQQQNKQDDMQQIFLEVIDEQNKILDTDQMNMDSSLSQCKIIDVYVKKQQQFNDSQQNSINHQDKIQLKNHHKLSFTTDQKNEKKNHNEILSLRNQRAATLVMNKDNLFFNLKQRQTIKSKYITSDEYQWRMTTKEDEKKMKVTYHTYKRYLFEYFGGWKFIFLSNLSIILFTICRLYNDYLLGVWAQIPAHDQQSEFQFYTISIIGSTFLLSFIVYLRAGSLLIQSWHATKKLHEDMIKRVLNAPINLYFDKTPLSRIMSIFSKDLNQLEIQMTYHISTFTGTLYSLIGIAFLAVQAHYSMIILIPFAFVMCISLLQKCIPALIDSSNFLRITKNPILSNVIETMNGSSTIRVYGRANEFVKYNIELLDINLKAVQIQSGVNSWFSLRIDFISVLLIGVISIACVLLRPEISENEQQDLSKFGFAKNLEVIEPILLSMLLSYVLNIQTFLVMLLKYYVQIETNMINAERCMSLCDIIQEVSIQGDQSNQMFACQKNIDYLLASWPQKGELEFRDVSIQYRPNSQIAIDKISFKIYSQEKIGIVGRTGAGKSTIGLSLTRIVEVLEGQIIIDGIDISLIPLKELRSKITLIPQDPVLFTGTLRFNLDPQNQFGDDELIDVLNKANLSKLLKQNEKGLYLNISENGSNFSSGERQLICVCRAVLRKSKLIILDEATAFIDIITERLIQQLVQSEFQYSTMITIAHRLNTIMNCDKIMVLSFGKIVEYDSPSNLMKDPQSQFKKFLKNLENNNHIQRSEIE